MSASVTVECVPATLFDARWLGRSPDPPSAPGQSERAPGQSERAPGQSERAPGHAGPSPESDRRLDTSGGEPRLDDLLAGLWEGLAAHRVVECPACGAEMHPEYGAHALPIGGRCNGCGSTLA